MGFLGRFSVLVEEQVIKTNGTNILIRALQINKEKSEQKDAHAKAAQEKKGKRCRICIF